MSTYQVGNTITWGLAVTDATGAAADVGTGPTAAVTLPDGTIATPAPTVAKVSTGNYTATMTASQAGRHRIAWSGSGVNSGGLNPYTDVADVWPADPRLIIGLADARAALNLPAGARVNDDEIRLYCAAATALIESRIGAVLGATMVESRDGDGNQAIALYQHPATITTVVENGTTLAVTDYYLDSAGILWRGARKGAGTWSATGRTVVTYTVGGPAVAPEVVLAAREAVKVQYQRSQQATRPMFGSADDGGGGFIPVGWGMVDTYLAAARNNKTPGMA